MRAISREIAQVAWAKSLPDVQKLVEERARATRRPGLMLELHGKGMWEDIGALKAWLRVSCAMSALGQKQTSGAAANYVCFRG